MSKTLHRNMYNLRSPGARIDQIEQPNPDPLAAVRYSCVYWVDHLAESGPSHTDSLREGGTVDRFLRECYLYWLEALGLLGTLPEGIASMHKLQSILQVG